VATTSRVTVLEDLSIRTSGAPTHASSRGAAQLADATAAIPSTSGVDLAVRMDFLNGLLHALWNAGLLEGQVMIGGLPATVRGKLPPLVRPPPASSPCEIDGMRCDVELQLGQVEIQLLQQSFAIRASAGARVRLDAGKVTLAIQDTPTLQVW